MVDLTMKPVNICEEPTYFLLGINRLFAASLLFIAGFDTNSQFLDKTKENQKVPDVQNV